MKEYKSLSHTGDIGIIVRGKSLEELFARAARAMFDILVDIKKVRGNMKRKFDMKEVGYDGLLRAWLGELLYIFSAKNMVFSKFDVKVVDEKLIAMAYGERFKSDKHNLKTELKAVTYHKLYVKKVSSGYEAQIIFDV